MASHPLPAREVVSPDEKAASVRYNDKRRKQKRRELEDQHKARLLELVKVLVPEKRPQMVRGVLQKRMRVGINGLLDDVLRCVKRVREGAASEEEKCDYRAGLMLSRDCGTLLLRREDVHVVESNLGMALFSPFEVFKGYQGQSLRIMTHADDSDELVEVVQRGQVGESVSVRLIRLCFEPASGSLLGRFVNKTLTVSHISAEGKAVMLTCTLSDEDRAPLTTSAQFFEDFFKRADAQPKGPCRIVSSQSVLDSLKWFDARLRVETPVGIDIITKRLWNLSKGFADIMTVVLEDAVRLYPWLGKDGAGNPHIGIATCLQHDGAQTAWHHYISHGFSGKLFEAPSLPGKSVQLVSALMLPPQGTGWESHTVTGVCLTFIVDDGRDVMGCFTFEQHPLEQSTAMQSQMLSEGSKAIKRHEYMVLDGEAIAEVEQRMQDDALAEVDFIELPYSSFGPK